MSENSVRVLLRGGLGNQLFQYASGFAKASQLEASLVIDASQLPKSSESLGGVSLWPEQISEFHHGAHKIIHNERQSPKPSRLAQLERVFGDRAPKILAHFGRFANERNANVQLLTSMTHRKIVINSYCDSPLYFSDQKDVIQRQVSSLVSPSDAYHDSLKRTSDASPLAIHVRLGDYKNLSSIYGATDPSYFERAISLSQRLDASREIWLFSDEPESALEILAPRVPGARIAPISGPMTGLETLNIMSKCSGLVASNSSFSWWAAYLMRKDLPVIFPRPFFMQRTLEEPKNLFENSWIQIGRSTSHA